MPKQPTPTTGAGLPRIGRFLMHYGDFHAFWSTFDVMVEILIMRELGTIAEKAANIAITVLVNGIADGHVWVERVLEGKRNFRGALVQLEAVKAYRKLVGSKNDPEPLRSS